MRNIRPHGLDTGLTSDANFLKCTQNTPNSTQKSNKWGCRAGCGQKYDQMLQMGLLVSGGFLPAAATMRSGKLSFSRAPLCSAAATSRPARGWRGKAPPLLLWSRRNPPSHTRVALGPHGHEYLAAPRHAWCGFWRAQNRPKTHGSRTEHAPFHGCNCPNR